MNALNERERDIHNKVIAIADCLAQGKDDEYISCLEDSIESLPHYVIDLLADKLNVNLGNVFEN